MATHFIFIDSRVADYQTLVADLVPGTEWYLFLTPVGAVAVETGLLAMQQPRHLVAVMNDRGGDARTMDQAGLQMMAPLIRRCRLKASSPRAS